MTVNDQNPSTAKVDFSRQVSWEETGDPVCPYKARVGPESWVVRVNDFPDENLYTLLKGGREAESFDEWPAAWSRPRTKDPQAQSGQKVVDAIHKALDS
jgi:hypothetical protein